MSVNESRRDFLKKSSILLGGVAVMGMTGRSQAAPEETAEVPSHPYPCCEFDLDRVNWAMRATMRMAAATVLPRPC